MLITCMCVYIQVITCNYTYSIQYQNIVFAAIHRFRILIPYALSVVRCQYILLITVPCLLMTMGIYCIFSVHCYNDYNPSYFFLLFICWFGSTHASVRLT